MELLNRSYTNRKKKQALGFWWVLLIILPAVPLVTLAQQDTPAHSSSAQGTHSEHQDESYLAIVWKWGNFFILFGGLGWYLRKPLQAFLESRVKAIEDGLASGRKAREEASTKLSEIEARLAQLDKEIEELKVLALLEAEEEKKRILENAKLEANKILELARREIESLKKSARLELKAHIAELAVKLAEERLRGSIHPEENKKMIQAFLQRLDAAKN